MKKIIYICILICTSIVAKAQVPQAINFQAVASDPTTGKVVPKQKISVRITLDTLGMTGNFYQEVDTPRTNPVGSFSLQVNQGTHAVPPSGNFNNIPWSSGKIRMTVETDNNGGFSFANTNIIALATVPYAFNAEGVTNMTLTGATTGDALVWKTPQNKWEPQALPPGTIYTGANGITVGGSVIGNTLPNVPNASVTYNTVTGLLTITDAGNVTATIPPVNINGQGGTTVTGSYPNPITVFSFNPWADYALYEEMQADNVSSLNTYTSSGAWTTVALNYTHSASGTAISRSGNSITLASGKYYVKAHLKSRFGITNSDINLNLKLKNLSASTTAISGQGMTYGTGITSEESLATDVHLEGVINVTTSNTTYDLEYFYKLNGNPVNAYTNRVPGDGEPEIYTTLFIQKIQ